MRINTNNSGINFNKKTDNTLDETVIKEIEERLKEINNKVEYSSEIPTDEDIIIWVNPDEEYSSEYLIRINDETIASNTVWSSKKVNEVVSDIFIQADSHVHLNKDVLDSITEVNINNWNNKSDFDGSYRSLTDKPTIPSIEGLASEEYINEYVENAIEDEIIFKTDMLTINSLGGINANTDLNGLSVKEILNKLLFPYIKPTVSVTGTPNGGVYEMGDTQTITNVKVVITKKSEKIIKIEILDGTEIIESLEDTTIENGGTFDFATDISVLSTNKQLIARVTDNSEQQVTASTKAFTFVYPYYWGICNEDDTINAELISGLNKLIEQKGTKSLTYNTNNQKMILAYPSSYGTIAKILDPNSFDVTSTFTMTQLTIVGLDETEQLYYVYTNNTSTVDDFKMIFSY